MKNKDVDRIAEYFNQLTVGVGILKLAGLFVIGFGYLVCMFYFLPNLSTYISEVLR